MSKQEILLTDSAVDFLKEEIGGGQGGSGVEYITVSIDGGTLTAEQLAKVFHNGFVKKGVFFRIDNTILVSSGHPRKQVFNSTVINGKYYSMEVDEFTGVYTVTEISVGGGGSGLKLINIYFKDGDTPDYLNDFQMFVDRDGLETYEDLCNYLMEKGATTLDGNQMRYPGVGFNADSGGYFYAVYITGQDHIVIVVEGNNSTKTVGNDEDFSITYLGQTQGE